MTDKALYIHTIGCQMNVYDADLMANSLAALGYRPVDAPDDADLAVVNTCAIRAKAEQKVFSLLGRLTGLKRRRPAMRIAVGGCVAQQAGGRILKRAPGVDLVFGTQALGRLPALVRRLEDGEGPLVDVDMTPGFVEVDAPRRPVVQDPVTRFVTVMQGCDNYCAYCVVPYVRGREASRHPDRVVEEVRTLVGGGVREVTLLGQNVNSYGNREGLCSFVELLERVAAVDGLARIRFTTSHPKDLSPALTAAFGHIEKLCPHIHLPVQAGSDRVLRRMNRRYDRRTYLERVAALRAVRPDIAITSDIIVGFPGEEEADFARTLELVETVRFDGLFAFHYSDRPVAPASRFGGKVPAPVQRRRLQTLLARQARISRARNRPLVGTLQPVLVEGGSKRAAGVPEDGGNGPWQWTGRTPGNKIVNFRAAAEADASPPAVGALRWVRIEEAFTHSLRGVQAPSPGRTGGAKGEACHAA